MKVIISIGFILFANSICSGQVRDSVCIHKFNQHYWQSIRPADSIIYSRYISNSEYFKKVFKKDSLFIKLNDHACPPKTIFIGEFTTSDSIHIIDFIEDVRPYLRVHFEGICAKFISRNLLPQLQNITLSTNIDSVKYKFKFVSCDLFIKNDNGVLNYKITDMAISPEARNSIMSLRENHYIVIDKVKIDGPNGIRTIEGITYQISN